MSSSPQLGGEAEQRGESLGAAQTAVADGDALVGKTLDGRYEIQSVLGEGGLGRVYRGRHLKLNRQVAIKILLEQHRQSGDVTARFEREAQALSALSHPNIVTVTDFGSFDGMLYLVMELVAGRDLDSLIEAEGAVAPSRVVPIMTQVLRSLAYAHGEGVIHRDLKLANVHVRPMPDGSDHVEVLDFGLAKFLEEDTPERKTNPKLTRAGMVMGTPAYMAPEQVDGASCDTRTDVYAAGVMLFEMLAGRLPFPYDETTKMLRAHLIEPPPKLRDIKPDLPLALEQIVIRAMAKSPDERFENGGAMLEALEAAEIDPSTLDAVTDKLKDMSKGMSAGLSKSVERFTDFSQELHLESRLEEFRKKLPAPLAEMPPWGLGAMLGGVILLFILIVMTTLAGGDTDGVQHEVELPELPEGVDLATLEQIDVEAARDPWEGWEEDATLPPELAPIKRTIDRGRGVGRRQLGSLGMFARDAPSDCRPVLLRGHAYANRGRLSEALPRYIEAFERDPSCRGDERMLRHLVRAAGARKVELNRDASAAILRIYGSEATAAIEARIERTRRGDEKERLRTLLGLLD